MQKLLFLVVLAFAACSSDNGPTTPQPVVPGADAGLPRPDAQPGSASAPDATPIPQPCPYPPCY
jgi:hypothetical protein